MRIREIIILLALSLLSVVGGDYLSHHVSLSGFVIAILCCTVVGLLLSRSRRGGGLIALATHLVFWLTFTFLVGFISSLWNLLV